MFLQTKYLCDRIKISHPVNKRFAATAFHLIRAKKNTDDMLLFIFPLPPFGLGISSSALSSEKISHSSPHFSHLIITVPHLMYQPSTSIKNFANMLLMTTFINLAKITRYSQMQKFISFTMPALGLCYTSLHHKHLQLRYANRPQDFFSIYYLLI